MINARAELTEARVASKADLSEVEDRLSKKIDATCNMLQEDILAVAKDVKDLKKLKPRVSKLEHQTA